MLRRRIEHDSPGLWVKRELERIGEERAAAVRNIREITGDAERRVRDAVDASPSASGGNSDGGQ